MAGVTKVHNNLKVGNPQAAQAAQPAAPGAQQMADNQRRRIHGARSARRTSSSRCNDRTSCRLLAQPSRPGPASERPYPPIAAAVRAAVPEPRNIRSITAVSQPPRRRLMQTPTGPVTVPQGTLLQLRTSEAVDSKRAKDGEPVQFTVIHDVAVGGVLAIPRGATVHGVVTEVKKVGSGELGGSSELALRLTSLDLGGQSYPLDSDQFKVKGPNKAGQTVGNAWAAALSAPLSAARWAAAQAAPSAPALAWRRHGSFGGFSRTGVWIPAEALVTFHLNTPLTVNPVSPQEAARLAQGLYPGGPNLYRRGYYPYGSPYYGYGYPYAYAYPPVYYRPYYIGGGYYYWR